MVISNLSMTVQNGPLLPRDLTLIGYGLTPRWGLSKTGSRFVTIDDDARFVTKVLSDERFAIKKIGTRFTSKPEDT